MTVSRLRTHDAYVWGVVEHLCTKIRTQFPEATFWFTIDSTKPVLRAQTLRV